MSRANPKRKADWIMKAGISNSPSLYAQVADDLRKKILNEDYKHNERLPNEKWLCSLYNISRTTLRKSIDQLIAEGLLERRSNRGVYVSYSKLDTYFDRPYSLFQEMVKSGITPSSKILSFACITADSELCGTLHCPPDTPLLRIERLRFADGVPFNINTIYLVEEFFPQFNPWNLVDHSLYEIFEKDYNIPITKTVQVVNTCLSNKEQSSLLNVAVRTPLLHTNSTIYSSDETVVEYQSTFILTDVIPYSYMIRLT